MTRNFPEGEIILDKQGSCPFCKREEKSGEVFVIDCSGTIPLLFNSRSLSNYKEWIRSRVMWLCDDCAEEWAKSYPDNVQRLSLDEISILEVMVS